jgi:hypothetical protein
MTTSFTPPAPLQTAVLFLVFNRPGTTTQVFEAIRQAQPPRLYVAADGPREGREGEAERVAAVRKIATAVNWPCELKTLFRDKNLGCKHAVSGAITWFFEHEEMGVILEDDCLPSQSFFWFCEYYLKYYKDDKRMFSVNGSNYLKLSKDSLMNSSYIFTDPDVWGWATWADRWEYYEHGPSAIKSKIFNKTYLNFSLRHWSFAQEVGLNALRSTTGKINSWAYPWTLAVLAQGGLCITPRKSLIDNIGFGVEATHTKQTYAHIHTRQELSNAEFSQINRKIVLAHWYLDNIHKRTILMKFKTFLDFFLILIKLLLAR